MAEGKLEGADIGVLVAYFVIVIFFGLWSSLKNRGSAGGYFLAGRSMNFILVGASLFASNVGSGHFIGLAGSGASSGIGIAVFELNAIFILLILGWIFVPVYVASGVFTMPEYLRKRYGGQRIRVYQAVLALLLSVFTKVAADLYAGALFIQQSLGWNLYPAIILLLAIAALFTIAGGLTAVIWTDFVQTVIMIIGAFYLMIVAFAEVGNYSNVGFTFLRAAPNTTIDGSYPGGNGTDEVCGLPPDDSMNLIRPLNDPNYPWPGVFIGLTINSIWYWCTDQVIVQRTLAAKNISHAKGATVLAGYIKFLPMWILVLPGMISRILFPDTIGCADPALCKEICDSEAGCTNLAYPTLVLELMPVGARGLMMAVMIASLMSSLTSVFNSSSTIFVYDIYAIFRKTKMSFIEEMVVARIFVLVFVAVGIAWIPIVQGFPELFQYIQSVTSYLAPPICAIYLLSIFWDRTNEQGAFWGLMIGLVIGLIRFIWENVYPKVPCGEENDNPPPNVISKVHYLHFGIILFVIVVISTVVISLLTKPIDKKHLVRLTFWTRFSEETRVDLDEMEMKPSASDGPTANVYIEPASGDSIEEKASVTATNGQMNPAYESSSHDVTVIHQSPPQVVDAEDEPCYKSALQWICGIESHEELELSPEELEALTRKQNSLHEEPFEKRLCDANAIALATVAIFFWGFFA